MGHTPDLRGPSSDANVCNRIQRHRPFCGRVDNELPYFIHACVPRIHAADQDIDFLVAPRVPRCEFAPYVCDNTVGYVAHGKSQRSRAFLIKLDLNFRIAQLYGCANI